MTLNRVLFAALSTLMAATAFANPGFLSSGSGQVPRAVEEAEKSILKIRFPYYFTMERKEAESFANQSTFLSAESRNEIQECLASEASHCSFRIHYVDGTAFVDRNDSSSLWTNCHLVHGWLQYQKYKSMQTNTNYFKRVRSEKLMVSLMDSHGHILAEDVPYDLEVAHVDNSDTPEFAGCNMVSDAVRIKGPNLGRPGLKWGTAAPGDSTFVGGYPHETSGRAGVHLASMNAKEEIFFWTRGMLHTPDSFKAVVKARGLSVDKYNVVFTDSRGLMMTNDGAQGMSGGPVLNAQGEVVGIFKGFLPAPDKNSAPLAALGFSNDGLRETELRSW